MKREYRNFGAQCRVDNCEKRAFCKGVCRMHYARYEKRGSFELPEPMTLLQKLFSNQEIDQNGCWLWTGGKNKAGYGEIYQHKDRTPMMVHRVAYEMFIGTIPDGHFVCHKCDVKSCFNPDHLFNGTALDNVTDACNKNLNAFGERQPRAVLTADIVSDLRSNYDPKTSRETGLTQKFLASVLGCSQAAIALAVNGKTWRRA